MIEMNVGWRRRQALSILVLAFFIPRLADADAEPKTIPETEPTVLDPVVSVAAVTQQHGYMTYDQLYGMDSNGVPRPQMVEKDDVDHAARVHRMALRAGLKFHDGTPVRAADAVASILLRNKLSTIPRMFRVVLW
jgi:peptide/nickel transport system substrate-binding protein